MKQILSKGKAFRISSVVLFLLVNFSLRAQVPMNCNQPYEIWNHLLCPIVVNCEVVDNGYPPGYKVVCTFSLLVPAAAACTSGPPAVVQFPGGCCNHDVFVVVVRAAGTLVSAPPTVNGTANPTANPIATGTLTGAQSGACGSCTSGAYNITWTPTHVLIN